jgi:hypothetical protein
MKKYWKVKLSPNYVIKTNLPKLTALQLCDTVLCTILLCLLNYV